MVKLFSVFFICFFMGSLVFADIDMSGVHAYPVPYNPKKSSAKVIQFKGWPSSVTGTVSLKMEVFDINGDKVVSRTFTSLSAAQWNARSEKGKLVSPGMYIIKLSLDAPNTLSPPTIPSDENFGKKIIRVLIAY